tara:strand:+ start:8203 stop:9015 length:813 start_codon:yes stop_codon:yes gene_type:complete
MRKTIPEHIANLTNKRISRFDPVDRLRTQLWLDSVFMNFKITKQQLQDMLSGEEESSGIVHKWYEGKHTVTPTSVEKVEKLLPNSSTVYELPIFTLLRNKPLKKKQLLNLMAPYLSDSSFPMWNLPNSQNGEDSSFAMPSIFLQDSDSLFQRGDLYGFQCILFLMRMAEAKNDQLMYLHYLKDAYKALPGLCRYRYFTGRWEEFLDAMIGLQSRMPLTSMLVMPNKKIIKKQIESKQHITFRAFRPRNPKTLRFVDLQEPYYEATFEWGR